MKNYKNEYHTGIPPPKLHSQILESIQDPICSIHGLFLPTKSIKYSQNFRLQSWICGFQLSSNSVLWNFEVRILTSQQNSRRFC